MHFLRKDEVSECVLTKPYACVRVRHELSGSPRADRLVLVVPEPDDKGVLPATIVMAKTSSLWCRLPARVKVYEPNGKEIRHSDRFPFWVSTETINPEHLLMQAEKFPGRS